MMKTYLVGGAVRDKLLNYPFHERDWVITGASVKEMLALGYQQVGKDFPVFLHPKTKEEHALARIERKSGHGYSGFEVDARPEVTLEEDLSRRDLTINAIAEDTQGNIIDPFNGVSDIEHKILRHVSDAFVEDPVRVLRLARFAARYHHLGFTIADETLNLMKIIVSSGELEHLVAERVWKEMEKALGEKTPTVFYEVLREVGALKVLLPEIDVLFGIPNPEKWHPEIDTGIHTMMVLEQAVKLSDLPLVRFAALCHDLGKGITPKELWPKHRGHEKTGIKLINSLCQRLKIPREFRELACLGSEYHLHSHTVFDLKPKTLLNMMEAFDIYRREERLKYFIDISEADARGRTGFEDRDYPQRDYLEKAMQTVLSITNKTLDDPSLSGKAIGDALRKARLQALAKLKAALKVNAALDADQH
ncbi:MAG: tRNA nucleotidyltransferase (CCA-adding enzyme) [Enterobacterales bacterium]